MKTEERRDTVFLSSFFVLRSSFFVFSFSASRLTTPTPRHSRLLGLLVAKKVDGIACDLHARLLLNLFDQLSG